MVKSGEDEEPIGVASALSLRRYGSLEALKQIKAHLLQHCEDAAAKQQLQEVQGCWSGLLSCCSIL